MWNSPTHRQGRRGSGGGAGPRIDATNTSKRKISSGIDQSKREIASDGRRELQLPAEIRLGHATKQSNLPPLRKNDAAKRELDAEFDHVKKNENARKRINYGGLLSGGSGV